MEKLSNKSNTHTLDMQSVFVAFIASACASKCKEESATMLITQHLTSCIQGAETLKNTIVPER